MNQSTKIKDRIEKLFKPNLKLISQQLNCNHNWDDKVGSSYFKCKKCGYFAEDKQLDKLIFEMKLMEKGADTNTIKLITQTYYGE